jgi:preprotein translocase subunit SecE
MLSDRRGEGRTKGRGQVVSKQRYVLLVFVIGAVLVGFTVEAATSSAFAQFAIPDNRVLGVLNTSSLLAVVLGLGTFAVLLRNRTALTFVGEVVGELVRVTWPSREEAVRASTTVVLTTVFMASLLAVYDFTWKNLADLILFTEG